MALPLGAVDEGEYTPPTPAAQAQPAPSAPPKMPLGAVDEGEYRGPAPAPAPSAATSYLPAVRSAAQKYGIPGNIYPGLIEWESSWNPSAKSGAGAIGLSQIMPSTARGMGVDPASLAKDPQQQIEVGARILRSNYDLLRRSLPNLTDDQVWDKALQAYNAGTGTVLSGKPLPKETQAYVPGVRRAAEKYSAETAQQPPPARGPGLLDRASHVMHDIEQGYQNAKTAAANLPGVRQAGDIGRAVLASPPVQTAERVWASRPGANIQPLALPRMMTGTQPQPGQIAVNPRTGAIIPSATLQHLAQPVPPEALFPNPIEFPVGAAAQMSRIGSELARPGSTAGLRDLEVGQAIRNQVRQQIGVDVPGPRLAAEAQANVIRNAATPRVVAATTSALHTAQPLPGHVFTTDAAANAWGTDAATAQARLGALEANGQVRQSPGGLWEMRANPAVNVEADEAAAQAGSHPAGAPLHTTVASTGGAEQAAQRAAMTGETGGINVGALQDYLERSKRSVAVTGDVADKLYQLRQQDDAVGVALRKIVDQSKVSNADLEAVYHALEDDEARVALSPGQRAVYDLLEPIRGDTEAMKQAMKKNWPMIGGQGYVRRYVQDGNSVLDRMLQTGRGRGAGLATTTGAMRHRQMVALTEETTGNRVIAHVEPGGHVTTWVDGQAQDLGTWRLKTRETLLDGELAPLNRRIDLAERQIKTLQGVRLNPQRVAALERRLSNLANETLDLGRTNTPQDARVIEREIRQLQENIDVASGGGAMERRVATLQRGVDKLRQEADTILSRYDPLTTNDKVFVGKGGQRFMVGQATTREIEAATPVRYYKNGLASVLLDHMDTARASRASQFLEHLKSDPEFLRMATPEGQGIAGQGWRGTRLPAFRGWVMDPKLAAEFDRVAGKLFEGEALPDVIEKANRLAITSMFMFPFRHVTNIGVAWGYDRGMARWFNPMAYGRLIRTSMRAVNAALHVNQDYMDYLDAGAPLMRTRGAAMQVQEQILSKMKAELTENPSVVKGLAEALGTAPERIINAVTSPSHFITWLSQDVATMQRIFEREAEGMTRAQAIAETGRWLPNYRMPATIFGKAGVSNFLSNRAFVIFAPWHYGLLKSFGQAAKGLLAGSVGDKLVAADKLAALGVMGLVFAPAADAVLHKLTGNRRAYASRPGQLGVASHVWRASHGQEPWLWAAESVVSPSPLVGIGQAELLRNKEWSDPNQTPIQNAATAVKIAAPELGPMQVRQALTGGGFDIGRFALSAVGANVPKRGPNEIRLNGLTYDSPVNLRPRVMELVAQGNSRGAYREVLRYNNDMYRTFLRAQWEQSVPQNPNQARRYVEQHGMKLPSYHEALDYVRRRQAPPPLGSAPRRTGTRSPYRRAVPLQPGP